MPTNAKAHPNKFRPLYLNKVPADIWLEIHCSALQEGKNLAEYLVDLHKNARTKAGESLLEPKPL